MSGAPTLESDLLQPDRQGDDMPPAEPQEPAQPAEPPAPVDDDAALDKLIEEQSIEVPGDVDKLVPLSAVTTLRGKLKEAKDALATAKSGSDEAATLKGQVQQLTSTLQQWQPYVQAYQAAARQQQQPQPPAEDTTELQEIARDFDFYKTDGTLDLDKARRHQERTNKAAAEIAKQHVAPLAAQSTKQQSDTMLERAKITAGPNGQKPDPEILAGIWSRLDPALTSTPEGAKQAWIAALGYTAAMTAAGQQPPQPQAQPQRGPDGKFLPQQQTISAPLYSEKAGGRDKPAEMQMSDAERKVAKSLGMSEKEYLESWANRPKGR